MKEMFEQIAMRLALCGLAASLAVYALRSWPVRTAIARLAAIWRGLTAFGRAAVCAFLLVGVLEADKTNNVPPNLNSPLPQMQQGGVFLTGFTGLTELSGALPHTPSSTNLVNLVNPVQTTPVQQTFAERWAANWNVCGAWKDSFWLPFEDGWVFPYGTNHLSGVEVVSQGMVWPTPFDTNAVAAVGVSVEIVPGLSSFGYEFTSSNSYRFVWTDAAIGRDTNNLVTAALELLRNGDWCVTTNGAVRWGQRALPFPHNGFGQDDEWVAANFTNATEILAVGYPQWVDAQVGTGLTNGLYKLTVTLTCDPPETTFLSVGNSTIAATNAGEYVFLVEKGPAYDLTVFPASSNVTVSAVDDIAPMERGGFVETDLSLRRGALRSGVGGNYDNGTWTPDGGMFWTDYVPGMVNAQFWWLPCLFGSPDVAHIDSSADAVEFHAVLSDYRGAAPTFLWTASERLSIASPNSQTTEVTADETVSWDTAYMSVSATFGGDRSLTSYIYLDYGTNDTPQAGVSVSVPRVMFQNDDDDNDDGIVDHEVVNFGNDPANAEDDVVKGGVVFRSDVFTNGTVRIQLSGFPGDVYTNDCEAALVPDSFDVAIEGEVSRTVDLYFNPLSWAPYQSPTVTAVWIPEVGEPQTSSVPFSVVKPVAETICSTTVEHSVLGTNHVYTVNPCGVAVGDDAYFSVKVSPGAFTDSDIVWMNYDGHVVFVDGNTGRNVHVRGVSPGDAELAVIIGGRTRQGPTFPLKVVTQQVFKITAWIVSNQKQIPARRIEDVQAMIEPLNDIYRQVGVSFYLDSVMVTNIPAAFNLLYDEDPSGGWDFDKLVDIGQGTDGIECYFVNDFTMTDGRNPPLAANTYKGLVMSARAGATTLAHEIGHAFGLEDVYVSSAEKDEESLHAKDVSQCVICGSKATYDWNGGCYGTGVGGARYYPSGTTMAEIIPRLVMYGVGRRNAARRDITLGNVDGAWYQEIGSVRVWYDTEAPVGFFRNIQKKASPNHE